MGYTRRGSKFQTCYALSSGTPGYAWQGQFSFGAGYRVMNLLYFLLCDWKTSWIFLYEPIDETKRKEFDDIVKKSNAFSINKLKYFDTSVFSDITSIISIPSPSSIFCTRVGKMLGNAGQWAGRVNWGGLSRKNFGFF